MEIEVTRPKQYQDKFRDYYLWADDQEVGKLKPNSTAKFVIPEGTQKIRATLDWCSSQEFDVKKIQANKIIIFNSFGTNLLTAIFLPLYYTFFAKINI